MRTSMVVTLGFVLAIAGCASEVEPGPGTVTDGSGSNSEDLGPLEAPTLEAVIPMAKVLRVQWSLSSTCDMVDGERRTDAVTFVPAFTAKGTDTDYVDEDAYEDQMYTYRLRCIRGDDASEYSNTLGGNPYLE